MPRSRAEAALRITRAAGLAAALGMAWLLTPGVAGGQTVSPEGARKVPCASKPGEREYCPADTSHGVVLVRSSGDAPCLLGKTWGYDDHDVWVADGCTAEFLVVEEKKPEAAPPAPTPAPAPGEAAKSTEDKKKFLEHIPNAGFRLYEGDQGEIYMRLFSYVRYLNQKGIDPTYVDAFGNVKTIQVREDVQLNKFFLPFSGWFLTPKFRYYLYVWSQNPAQGDSAQVVGAGNLSYTFNRFVTLGGGITSLPSTRSTEGQFPYWLGVDDRLISDEFFRGSYTEGFWLKGEILSNLKYMAMVATNLSILGVSSSQLDQGLNTQSFMLAWFPTTGEFGLYGTYGDYDDHQKIATRLAAHYTHSREDKQTQPATNGIENTQIRLSDGSIVFTPDLFAPGTTVERVTYEMVSADAGIKYKGFSLEGEVFFRKLSNFTGINTGIIPSEIKDHGFQIQSSAMVLPKRLQVYLSGAEIYGGAYGDDSEIRAGLNWYFLCERGLRFNGEFIHVNRSPVGYGAYPLQVGSTGNVFHLNVEMNF
ncbi:MAG TPA: DUF3011 domain-containing protein [Thermoanaerobaculia bacterium]